MEAALPESLLELEASLLHEGLHCCFLLGCQFHARRTTGRATAADDRRSSGESRDGNVEEGGNLQIENSKLNNTNSRLNVSKNIAVPFGAEKKRR